MIVLYRATFFHILAGALIKCDPRASNTADEIVLVDASAATLDPDRMGITVSIEIPLIDGLECVVGDHSLEFCEFGNSCT